MARPEEIIINIDIRVYRENVHEQAQAKSCRLTSTSDHIKDCLNGQKTKEQKQW